MSTFNIDPTKIKPNMVIYTPTLEQAQAVCSYIGDKKFIYFNDYKETTCINTNNGKHWSYYPKSFYKDEGYTITPFEDILVKEPKDSTIEHKYNIGDKVLVKPNLGGHINTRPGMEKLIGKVVTIKEQREYDYYYIEEMTYAWHAQMFEPAPTPNQTTVAHSANPIPTIKETKMKTLKDNASTQIKETKVAVTHAAELKAGQLINKQALKLIKPQLPMMVRGYADHPVASVVLANIIGLALKQYAPENPKLAKVSNLMLQAAAFDTIDSFNIDEMVDSLLANVKLPAGISLED